MRTTRAVSEGGGNRVSAERNSVLHSWCIQAQWDAPTVIGGAGARLHLEDGRSILDMSSLAECSNLGHQHPRRGCNPHRPTALFRHNLGRRGAQLAERLLGLRLPGGRVFTVGARCERTCGQDRAPACKPRGVVIARDRSPRVDPSGDGAVEYAHGAMIDLTPCISHVSLLTRIAVRSAARATLIVASVAAAIAERRPLRCRSGRHHRAQRRLNGIVAPDNYWPAVRLPTRSRAASAVAANGLPGNGTARQVGRRHAGERAYGRSVATRRRRAVCRYAARLEEDAGTGCLRHPPACAAGVAVSAYTEDCSIRALRMGGMLKGI
jgi:taurine--2-oxoglutarate transaminase